MTTTISLLVCEINPVVEQRNVRMADRDFVISDQNEKKIRFRTASRIHYINDNKVEDHFNDEELSNCWDRDDTGKESSKPRSKLDDLKNPSLFKFLGVELTRSYLLEHDEERYSARREKVYSFMKIPREVEKFMTYGFFQCADSFLFVYTFLPLRFILALVTLVSRSFQQCFGSCSHSKAILAPAEICDILKAFIVIVCSCLMFYIDTNMMYHLIKSQSVIKLYIFFNMLEVGDRLFSAFGQDTIDALFWTAAEPRDRRREHLGVIPHLIFAGAYVFFHSLLVLCQATTLNVAINSNNKALLTIMMSNNFVELKGSVFKKFDKNNLFQVSCSDVRERFHLFVLLFIVVLQTMKEYSWKQERFWVLVPDCLMVLLAELLVDWLKHAFITRFNELPVDVYRDYTISLAYDMAQTRQKHAFSDHSDLVARRMGFIPLPLGVVMVRVLVQAIHIDGPSAFSLLILAYMCLASFRVLNSIVILGKACDLIKQHRLDKAARAGDLTPPWNRASSPTNHRPPPISSHLQSILNGRSALSDRPVVRQLILNSPGPGPGTGTPASSVSPMPLKAAHPEAPQGGKTPVRGLSLPEHVSPSEPVRKISDIDTTASCHLGPAAIFSNSAVDINNVCLNEELLSENGDEGPALGMKHISEAEAMTRSEPNILPALSQQGSVEDRGVEDTQSTSALAPGSLGDGLIYGRKAESEPSIPLAVGADEGVPASLPQTQNSNATKVDH